MANVNIHKTVDDLDQNAPAPAQPWTMPTPRPSPRLDWPTAATRYGFMLLFAALAWWQADDQLRWWIPRLVVVLAVAWFVVQRLWVVHIGGVPVWAHRNNVTGLDVVTPLGSAAIEHARRALPSVSSYSPSIQQLPAPKALPSGVTGDTVDSPEVTILENIGPLPASDWLRRLDAQPHIIFAAKTRGGKSTMAKYGMQPRIERGESFFVIDPHSNGWLDLPSVGGGLRWDEVADAITHVTDLYRTRQNERRQYLDETGDELPHDHFPRLNVIMDEANETRLMLDKRVWEPFLQVMGSGARKCGISLWLIAQSALIKNLGGSSTMRRNFTVFALDHATITELLESEETNKARRELINARIAGTDFPACMVDNGYAYLLDRGGIDRAYIQSARENAWTGFGHKPARMAVAASAVRSNDDVLKATFRVPLETADRTDAGTDARTVLKTDKVRIYLKAYANAGKTREQARALMEGMGLEFQNSLWTDVRRELGL